MPKAIAHWRTDGTKQDEPLKIPPPKKNASAHQKNYIKPNI